MTVADGLSASVIPREEQREEQREEEDDAIFHGAWSRFFDAETHTDRSKLP